MYTELLPKLIQHQLLARVLITPMEPPYPRWYDVSATCDYHYGIKGHSTENCLALKNQVQALKNAGYVNFGYNKDGVPNIISNPLPNHSGPKINGILESLMDERKTYVQNVIMPMGVIFEKLVEIGFLQLKKGEAIKEEESSKGYCQYHAEVRRHSIHECNEF